MAKDREDLERFYQGICGFLEKSMTIVVAPGVAYTQVPGGGLMTYGSFGDFLQSEANRPWKAFKRLAANPAARERLARTFPELRLDGDGLDFVNDLGQLARNPGPRLEKLRRGREDFLAPLGAPPRLTRAQWPSMLPRATREGGPPRLEPVREPEVKSAGEGKPAARSTQLPDQDRKQILDRRKAHLDATEGGPGSNLFWFKVDDKILFIADAEDPTPEERDKLADQIYELLRSGDKERRRFEAEFPTLKPHPTRQQIREWIDGEIQAWNKQRDFFAERRKENEKQWEAWRALTLEEGGPRILQALSEAPDMTVSALAEKVGGPRLDPETDPKFKIALRQLVEDEGLVKPVPEGRVRITAQGRARLVNPGPSSSGNLGKATAKEGRPAEKKGPGRPRLSTEKTKKIAKALESHGPRTPYREVADALGVGYSVEDVKRVANALSKRKAWNLAKERERAKKDREIQLDAEEKPPRR